MAIIPQLDSAMGVILVLTFINSVLAFVTELVLLGLIVWYVPKSLSSSLGKLAETISQQSRLLEHTLRRLEIHRGDHAN